MMKKVIILLLLSTFTVSCNNEVSYSLITSNRSDEEINEVQVWFGDKPVNNGIISPGDHVTIASFNFKLKEKMRISWIDEGKKVHQQFFKTFDFIPKSYGNGNVIFAYEGNDKFILEFYMPKNDFPKLF